WGDARQDLGLADVLGVSMSGEVVGPHSNSYMRIEQRNKVNAGFEGTDILPGPEYRLPVRQRGQSPAVLTVVPSYPSFPPEMVYPRTPHTAEPAACFREAGSSRVAYFAGDVDRTFWLSGSGGLRIDFTGLIVASASSAQKGRDPRCTWIRRSRLSRVLSPLARCLDPPQRGPEHSSPGGRSGWR